MRKWVLIFTLLLGFWVPTLAQQLRNDRLVKVDPAGWVFHEFRVAFERRIKENWFAYGAPYLMHQNWLARDNERYGRPTFPQKYYGLGGRIGIRRYFIPKNVSPEGLFFQGMICYRHTWVNNLDVDLNLVSKGRYGSVGLGAVVGYQKQYGPGFVNRKLFAYGIMGGLEYYRDAFPSNGVMNKSLVTQNWYEFPFFPDFLQGFRVYLGVEVGFAFLQRRLHW
jgi:hypothetical protein